MPPLPPIAERQAALARRFTPWPARTLDQALDAAADEFGDRPCVVTDEREWSYRELQAWSQRIAAGLVAAGVRPGDHVAMLLANQPEFVALKFGIARAGAVAVPVNFLNRRDELGYVLRQSNAVLLVTMDRFRNLDYLGMLDELAPGWEALGSEGLGSEKSSIEKSGSEKPDKHGSGDTLPRLKRVVVLPTGDAPLPTIDAPRREGALSFARFAAEAPHWQPLAQHPGPASNCDIIYTSGTTGSPKGVMLTHDMMLRTAFGSAYGRAFEDGRRILFSLPMYHVYGYVEGMLSVLPVGGAIVPQIRFDALETLRGVERHRATDILLIPTMTLALIDELKKPGARFDLSSLHAVISSGGRAPAYIWQDIFTYLRPKELTTGYGMTEVTASSTVTRPDDGIDRLLATNGRLRDAGQAGDPAYGGKLVVYRVVDPETGRDVAAGDVGELIAQGPGVTQGYYDKPEATAEAFTADGWLRSGDLGRIDAEGYLTLVGRRKESYRCGGEQVLPTEIEDVLVTHPAVLQAHVVPVPDARMGEVGVAWVVLRDTPAVAPAELIELCGQRLARFKVPRHVLTIRAEDIPATPSGRARKFLLVEKAMKALQLS